MAKGQKRSNREVRKPKTAAPKPTAAAARSFLEPSPSAAKAMGKGRKGRPGAGG